MGAAASSLPSLSPKNQKEHFDLYDEFCRMKIDKMTDEDIYATLKKMCEKVNPRRTDIPDNRLVSLRNLAFNHFSQTLETNRISFEKEKSRVKSAVAYSRSCHKLDSHYSYSVLAEKVNAGVTTNKPPEIMAVESSDDLNNENIAVPTPQNVAKSTKRPRPQLTIFVDAEVEDDEIALLPLPAETITYSPRVEGRISPSGAVHVGKFAINEKGLQSNTRRQAQVAFLTAGKSDFVEIGFLGSGATSSIIEALHIPTLTIVALKMLPTKDSSDMQCIWNELSVLYQNLAKLRLIDERLDEEENSDDEEKSARQALSSPCQQVLAMYDAFLDARSGMVNLVVEYMDGGSLQDLVERGGCQDEQILSDIAHQCLLGLDFLHDQNCIHRDIKPGNILVNCAGIVKLADFGVAKAMDINFEKNVEASFVGTMCYMAPERMMNRAYGVAADVWSFGLTLLAVVQGRYPLLKSGEKSNYWDLTRVICEESSPQLEDKFSKNMRTFIQSCLRKNPGERATVKDLLYFPFVDHPNLPAAHTPGAYHQHAPLSAFTLQSQLTSHERGPDETTNAMLIKYAHLETVLQKTELKYEYMVQLWKQQGNFASSNDDSFMSISARSISMKTPAEPMTRLPNFVSGLHLWKHLANQLHLPLDLVISTASTIINRKYFAK